MRNSCTTASSSSVVTPGLQCSPARTTACAARRPARRIRSIISGVCTVVLERLGSRFPTYSGRGMLSGTSRHGETWPWVSGALMASSLASWQARVAVDAHRVRELPELDQGGVALAGVVLAQQ